MGRKEGGKEEMVVSEGRKRARKRKSDKFWVMEMREDSIEKTRLKDCR